MKKLIILSAIALSGLFYNTANAQIRVHIGLNLWPHRVYVQPAAVVDVPAPAPAVCEDENAPADYDPADDYYYLPDVNAYYSVANQCYYYNDGDNWVSAAYLPGEYYNFDWRAARHFEVRAVRPYLHSDFYMNRFHGERFNWARYNAPREGYFDRDRHFDNRGGYDQRFADRDNRHFDNRGGYDQRFADRDNRQFDNRGRGFGQPDNQNFGNRGNDQGRFSQNNNRGGYSGHTIAARRMF